VGAANGNLMTMAMGIRAVGEVAGSYSSAQAMRAKGEYERRQADSNARLAMIRAEDALNRGDFEANAIKKKADQVKGAQKTALAANGIDVNSSLAGNALFETEVMSELDMMQVKNNAWREAWGYRVQANDLRGQGKMALVASKGEARSTMLTGGLGALYYGTLAADEYRDPTKVTPDQASENYKERKESRDSKNRSKKNPLFQDSYLNASWWRSGYANRSRV
jgi:hypothetical protein